MCARCIYPGLGTRQQLLSRNTTWTGYDGQRGLINNLDAVAMFLPEEKVYGTLRDVMPMLMSLPTLRETHASPTTTP